MTSTDESLVALSLELRVHGYTEKARTLLDHLLSQPALVALSLELRVHGYTENARTLLDYLLSQPPSGGWDDAAVERASVAFMEKWTDGSWSFLDIEVCKVAMRAALNAAERKDEKIIQSLA